MPILLYFDTNVLCRPFDDQTNRRIRRETEAFQRLLERIEANEAAFITSEILLFEIQRIISPADVSEVRDQRSEVSQRKQTVQTVPAVQPLRSVQAVPPPDNL